jgi:hypothetical protein
MSKHTRLNKRYWRYLIRRKGRLYTVNKFNKILNKSKGDRKDELVNIYIEVFRASTSR